VREPGQVPDGPVDVLVRPEGLAIQPAADGNGIVTTRTFLGAVTRVGVLLSGDTEVRVDVPSTGCGEMTPGTAVRVTLPATPVLVAPRS
jgi:putative spermidine/putrescine transport system ATP-binding protein